MEGVARYDAYVSYVDVPVPYVGCRCAETNKREERHTQHSKNLCWWVRFGS